MEQQVVDAPETTLSTGSSLRLNLPIPPTPLIGREWELAAALTLLTGVKVRLLTITGPGGVGKTRISLQIGSLVAGHFPDGVHFVSLAPIHDSSTVISTIASSLGIRDDSARPLLDRLKHFIARKRLLLILDNFEQIVPAGPLIVELLAAAPELKVIVTSRAALRVRGEQEFPLSPLPLPDLKEGIDAEAIRKSESVALFEQAAQGVKPEFSITPENATTIAEICARVDGLPLAIELAAARMRILSPKDILERLSNRFGLLTGGPRDLPTRQQTLHNAIEWSFDLLEERERRLFRRLAVFRGGCTLDAVETICRMPDDPPMEILDLLTSLIDKSMIRQHEDANGDTHFTMLESIREFAQEQLDLSGETDAMRRNHVEYYSRLSLVAGKEVYGRNQPKWTKRIDAEHANMREALEWALANEDVESIYTIVTSLTRYWAIRGQLHYALAQLEKLVAFGERLDPRKLGTVLNQYGSFAWSLANIPLAMEIFERGRKVLDEVNDTDNLARIYNNLANCLMSLEQYDQAQEYYLRSLEIREKALEPVGLTTSIIGLGNIEHIRGNNEKALEYYHRSLAIGREAGDRDAMTLSLMNLGVSVSTMGDLERAKSYLIEAVEISREGYSAKGLIQVLPNLAGIATQIGDNQLALQSHMEALEIAEATGHPNIRFLNECVGQVYSNMGDCSKAATYLRQALVLHGDSEGAEEDLVMVIADAGYLAMRAGRNETAVLLLSSTEETWRERLLTELWSGSVTCYNDSLENTRKTLGDERFDQVWKRGKGMTLPQVIDETLRFLEEMEKEDINVGPIPGTWNGTPLNPPSEEKAPSRKEEFRATPTAPYPNDLTTREVEVLRLVAQGLTDAEVGEKLFISTRTVNAHLRSIYSKLGVTTRVDASLFAKEHKLV